LLDSGYPSRIGNSKFIYTRSLAPKAAPMPLADPKPADLARS
jgi:hypothetical protein